MSTSVNVQVTVTDGATQPRPDSAASTVTSGPYEETR